MRNKKIFAVCCAAALAVAMTSCAANSASSSDNGSVTENTSQSAVSEDNAEQSENTAENVASAETAGSEGIQTEVDEHGISLGSVSITGNSNVLVAYFSLTGNREYQSDVDAVSSASITNNDGKILGNAEVLALTAQETTGGDLFFIEVSDKYPESFDGTSERSSSEQVEDACPELAAHIEDMKPYDTVILIYPDWWGSLPQAVLTFLEEYDFSGKTILPIATSQGSGLGSGPQQISSACPGATVADGLSANDASSVSSFLTDAGLSK